MEEVEVKFLDINPETIKAKLNSLGAKKVFDKIYKRRVYDYPDRRLDKIGAWLRLRDEGDAVKLTYKKRLGVNDMHSGLANDSGMEEIEIEVSDFEETTKLLTSLGFKEKFYQENRRVRFMLGKVEIDIDYWPLIKPYLEVEAQSWDQIKKTINLLGLKEKDQKIFSTQQVYKLNGINENEFSILTLNKQVKS